MNRKFFRGRLMSLMLSGLMLTVLTTCEKPERVISFITLEALEADISYTSATLKGEIIDAGSQPVDDYGIVYSTESNPRIGNGISKTAGTSLKKGEFSISISSLTRNTKYYFRAYVTIDDNDIHSDKIYSFTTKDYQAPSVTAGTVTAITMSSASLNGEVTSNGGEAATTRGLCWGASANPTITSCIDTTVNGTGIGTFIGRITGLTAGTRYYARTYAINSKGITYNSTDVVFKTHNLPTVTTTAVTNITGTGASSGGNVPDDGEVNVTVRGVCWSTITGPTISLTTKTTDGSGKGIFSSTITGLTPGTLYYVRAYATNQYGTSYGAEIPFTAAKAPLATTNPATLLGMTVATLNASVNANGSSTTVTFEYGLSTSYGTSVTATPGTVTGSTDANLLANITGLNPGTTYHFRVVAVNSGGEANGNDHTFVTVQVPGTSTQAATNITTASATLNGIVNANNSSTIVTFEYGTTTSYGASVAATPSPVTGNSDTPVSATITSLTPGTTYHFRVRALSDGGEVFGSDQVFTTLKLPDATALPATSITGTTATLTGTVNANNSLTTVTFEYGLTTAYGATATAAPGQVSGNSATVVSANISGLTQSTEYHYRVKAVSAAGTSFSGDLTFNTSATPPTATTGTATSVTTTTATLAGTVNANNHSTTVTFEYGLTTSYGTEVTAVESPVNGTSSTSVSKGITGLNPSTTYHYRVKAVNAGGTVYGSDQTFFTGLTPPTATTGSATSNTSSTATLEGTVNANGNSTTVTFEYGLTTSYGAEVTAAQSPVTGSGPTSVSAGITGLNASATYHYRVKAVSSGGTTYGSDLTFTTLTTVTDYDGNIYNTVRIGTQVWISENLKTTHYRDGTAIPNITTSEWGSLTYGSYRWLNNDIANKNIYGALYNSFTVVDNRNLCPAGWHVPTLAEFNTLFTYLGGEAVAGGKLKEAGTTRWVTPNTGATNESGFTALPGSYCTSSVHYQAGYDTRFYTSTWYNQAGSTYWRGLDYNNSGISSGMSTYDGYSVRCIQGEGLVLPAVTTGTVTNIGATTAASGGNVTSTGGSALTARGVCWSTTQHPIVTGSHTDDGTATGTFTSSITGLTPGTTYYLRAYATNGVGTAYGNEVSFKTSQPPTTTTGSATSIASSSATLGGTINANGYSSVVTFEYGLTTSYGSEVTAVQSPVTGTSSTSVSAAITGLNPSTTYHFRVKGVSSEGTSTGNDATFTTASASATVTDIDGNTYNTVQIGTQTWMAENLKVTKYNNGISIPLVTNQATWGGLTTHAYCWYNNDEPAYKNTYGAIYNWYTVYQGNLCPEGWHIPTDAEWTLLANFLGGASASGGKLKEQGLTHWETPNTGATNESGFNGLPGGYRGNDFYEIARTARWWSGTENGASIAWITSLSYLSASQSRIQMGKFGGMSVRCLKGTYPLVETNSATTVTSTTATLNGKVNPNSESTVVTYEYGLTTGYGSEITATQSPVNGTVPLLVSAAPTGLIPNTNYHFRVKAVNAGGTSYGSDFTFTTLVIPPSSTTGSATSVASVSATLNGVVNANNLSTAVTFEYGTTTSYGSSVSATQSPVTGTTPVNVSASLTSLTPGTTYHYRVKAVSSGGTSYGSDVTFVTDPVTVSDIDGNTYNVVRIGTQLWTKENLKASNLNNGTAITLVTANSTWSSATYPAYCYYNNDQATNNATYGALYNWYTVSTGTLCPSGWHVPTDNEWKQLEIFLGMNTTTADLTGWRGTTEGGKIKETGTIHWSSPNTGATNESGFTGLPGGIRFSDPLIYGGINSTEAWWSITEEASTGNAWWRGVYWDRSTMARGSDPKFHGFAIRCIKD